VIVDNAELQAKVDKLQKGPTNSSESISATEFALDGWMMKPPNFDPTKKYPILFYVYTEPPARRYWIRGKGTNYLWFLMLTQHRLHRRERR
jgi:dipeptidyl-peptidase-4